MLTAAVLSALMLQQAAAPQIVWSTPVPEPEPVAVTAAPIPDWARTDPYGYERSECHPAIRAASETMEGCQARVRFVLAANLGDALPGGLRPVGSPDNCRQEAAGDRYALQCGVPSRSVAADPILHEETCENRPQVRAGGSVSWRQDCRPTIAPADDKGSGFRLRLGGQEFGG